jgi:hypothetical protein
MLTGKHVNKNVCIVEFDPNHTILLGRHEQLDCTNSLHSLGVTAFSTLFLKTPVHSLQIAVVPEYFVLHQKSDLQLSHCSGH